MKPNKHFSESKVRIVSSLSFALMIVLSLFAANVHGQQHKADLSHKPTAAREVKQYFD